MTMNTYDRPREKLAQKGVSALTNAELLQVVIGSGTAGIPVTKIARKVNKALRVHGLNIKMTHMTSIQGLGTVKASQILAGFELTMRLLSATTGDISDSDSTLEELYNDLRGSKNQTLLYAFFDGDNRLIDDGFRIIEHRDNTVRMVRKLFADALAQSTASVLIAIGGRGQLLEPSMLELSLARDVYKMSKLLALPVKAFTLVSETGEYALKEEGHG